MEIPAEYHIEERIKEASWRFDQTPRLERMVINEYKSMFVPSFDITLMPGAHANKSFEALIEKLRAAPNLRTFGIANIILSVQQAQALVDVAGSNNSIEEFIFEDVRVMSEAGQPALTFAPLVNIDAPHIVSFRIVDFDVDNFDWKSVFVALCSPSSIVTHFTLNNWTNGRYTRVNPMFPNKHESYIMDIEPGLVAWLKSPGCSLEYLNVSRNNIGRRIAILLDELIKSAETTRLTTLLCEHCDLISWWCVRHIITFMQNIVLPMKHVSFSHNPLLYHGGVESLMIAEQTTSIAFFKELLGPQQIEKLEIIGCGFPQLLVERFEAELARKIAEHRFTSLLRTLNIYSLLDKNTEQLQKSIQTDLSSYHQSIYKSPASSSASRTSIRAQYVCAQCLHPVDTSFDNSIDRPFVSTQKLMCVQCAFHA
jgi:hypothetical protein